MQPRVKICGITTPKDALLAVEEGADAIGLMFYESSPRAVTLPTAAAISKALCPFIAKVGVFVDAELEIIQNAIQTCGLDAVQLHGEEPPEFSQFLNVKTVKAFRVQDENSLKSLPLYPTDAWLLDSYVPGVHGGTGARFNWDLAIAAKKWGRPIILAGGLAPENVGEAIRKVQPFAVDVSSGVEESPGKKDRIKMRDFIREAKRL